MFFHTLIKSPVMTSELEMLREEMEQLKPHLADLAMLEGLANNVVYLLSKMQRKAHEPNSLWKQHEKRLETVLSNVLQTLNKELAWALQEEDAAERRLLFEKARLQFLEDLDPLYD